MNVHDIMYLDIFNLDIENIDLFISTLQLHEHFCPSLYIGSERNSCGARIVSVVDIIVLVYICFGFGFGSGFGFGFGFSSLKYCIGFISDFINFPVLSNFQFFMKMLTRIRHSN